jgi:3-oxoacyl-[acyl-carrier-protein] synthase-1
MNSTTSGNVAVHFKVKGQAISVCSSFAAGPDNIGQSYELIKYGLQDLAICGAAEEEVWKQVGAYFDNAGAMPGGWNEKPDEACRPYDRDRSGFVMSAGAGILVLESMDHAKKRGAPIKAEIVGYGSANDGSDLFRPSGVGLKRAMGQALHSASGYGCNRVDYINGHGTGTTLGDHVEVKAVRDFFDQQAPLLSSTKGLAGHGMGASGAQEAVYALLMLCHGFVAPTRNLIEVDEECRGVPHVQTLMEAKMNSVMTVSVGLGGTASCLLFKRL